jgi:hypothetical protein
MNEQTKTHIEHAEQIAKITAQFKEREFMCELLHEHINKLNKEISDLKIQKQVASECHDSRLKDLSDRDILITQLQTTIYDILDRLKSDSKSTFCSATTRKYADEMFDLIEYQYFENTGKNLTDND